MPYRPATAEEKKILQSMTDRLGIRFVDLAAKHRNLNPAVTAKIATARIYLANEALELGMVDEIGYLDQAISKAKQLAGLPDDARVVVYRRTEYPDDNIYNTSTRYGGGDLSLISVDLLPESLNQFRTGFTIYGRRRRWLIEIDDRCSQFRIWDFGMRNDLSYGLRGEDCGLRDADERVKGRAHRAKWSMLPISV